LKEKKGEEGRGDGKIFDRGVRLVLGACTSILSKSLEGGAASSKSNGWKIRVFEIRQYSGGVSQERQRPQLAKNRRLDTNAYEADEVNT